MNFNNQKAKETAFLKGENRFIVRQDDLKNIPSKPIAYWVSLNLIKTFQNKKIADYSISDGQTKTGNNDKYLRQIWEVNSRKIGQGRKWVIHAKGGTFRRWYGNIDTLIDWSETARQHYRSDHVARIAPEYIWFRKGICWSLIGSGKLAVRLLDDNSTFNLAAPSIFFNDEYLTTYVLGYLNTPIADKMIKLLNPTINTNISDIILQPLIISDNPRICDLVEKNISSSHIDWDSFETSWDFQTHPLITYRHSVSGLKEGRVVDSISAALWEDQSWLIKNAYEAWEYNAQLRFNTLKANEEELNRIFIDIYGLQDELTPEVEDKDVTVRKADLGREIRSFISYTVGCMFGRYSLDVPGLVYAGGEWDKSKYSTYIPEDDNILPITDAEYFDDDIVVRFVDFVKVVYGKDTLAENLEFIANALYPNANTSARESIRRYFQNDFFKDHCRIYQKRPIYWLFDSGKQNGFKALIYLHRYDKYTVARVRAEYLHPLQRKYEAEIERMSKLTILPETSARDKGAYKKQIEKINKQIAECRAYDQIIAHIAAQTIELDLDDGVKVNYEKFQGVEVPREDNKGTVKMNLLGKI